MGIDLEKLEGKLDKVVVAGTEIQMGIGGVKFQSMIEIMEFARLMSMSQLAVPPHLRANPGACLAICTKSLRFGFDPFSLAEHSFSMKKKVKVTVENPNGGRSTREDEVETIAYDSYVIRAVIEAHAPIKGRLNYSYAGEGENRTCTVSAVLRETGEVVSHTSPTLGTRIKSIGKNDYGNIKGSPLWESKPDVQLGYDTARDLCRLHFPETLMGWYDKDELEETVRAETAQDITPKPDIAKRLTGGKKKRGFDAEHVANETAQAQVTNPNPVDKTAETPKATEAAAEPKSTAEIVVVTSLEPETKPAETAAAVTVEPVGGGPAVETPIQRGKRLLGKIKTAAEVSDLYSTIADELTGDEPALKEWGVAVAALVVLLVGLVACNPISELPVGDALYVVGEGKASVAPDRHVLWTRSLIVQGGLVPGVYQSAQGQKSQTVGRSLAGIFDRDHKSERRLMRDGTLYLLHEDIGPQLPFARSLRVSERLTSHPPQGEGRARQDNGEYRNPSPGILPPRVVLIAVLIGLGGAGMACYLIIAARDSEDHRAEHDRPEEQAEACPEDAPRFEGCPQPSKHPPKVYCLTPGPPASPRRKRPKRSPWTIC